MAVPLHAFASIGRIHIVAIAALGTLTFGWLFSGQTPLALGAICALDWFVVNLLNRVVDLREDDANGIAFTDVVARHRTVFLALGFALLAGSLATTHALFPQITALRLGYHALGLAYNWPLLPGGRRIKQLYFFKNTASGVGFMLTVFGYPLAMLRGGAAFPPGISTATVIYAGVFFFALEISYEVLYDLRDMEGDALADVRSYPVVHGAAAAEKIVYGLILISALSLVAGLIAGAVPYRLFVMIAAPVVQLVYARHAIARGVTTRDCIALTWIGAALLFVYQIWVALDLPGTYA